MSIISVVLVILHRVATKYDLVFSTSLFQSLYEYQTINFILGPLQTHEWSSGKNYTDIGIIGFQTTFINSNFCHMSGAMHLHLVASGAPFLRRNPSMKSRIHRSNLVADFDAFPDY